MNGLGNRVRGSGTESDRLLDRVGVTLRRERLLDGIDVLWLAVSGGADSVALLHALHRLCAQNSPALRVLHIDHGLRDAASDADADFVRSLCHTMQLPLSVRRIRIPAVADRNGESLEMAARRARLEVYRAVCGQCTRAALATGHQADDVAEMLLLRLARGAGMGGLAALGARSLVGALHIVRPLIECTRSDILAWLKEQRLVWREDVSNADAHIPRNRLRHETLPWLEANGMPGLRSSLVRTAAILRVEDAFLSELSAESLSRCRGAEDDWSLSAACLTREPLALQRRVVLDWLWSSGVAQADFEAVGRVLALAADARGSRQTPLRHGWTVRRIYDRLYVVAPDPNPGEHPPQRALLYRCSSTRDPGGWSPRRRLVVRQPVLRNPRCSILEPHSPYRLCAWIAPWSPRHEPAADDRLGFQVALNAAVWAGRPLRLRPARPGDRMRPSGLRGTRKLQDLWVNVKVPRALRHALPLLLCRNTIVWAPGLRPAQGWTARRGRPALWLRVEINLDNPIAVSVQRNACDM